MSIAIAGATGRMGHMLIEAVLGSDDCSLAGALDIAESPALGQDAGAFLGRSTGVAVTANLHEGLARADVLIDFTRPEGTLAHLAVCRELGVRAVVGTTGFTPDQKRQIAAYAERIGIVLAPNMSVGVNVMLRLLDMAARSLDEGYDIEVIEAHHRHKVDAPSGTALAMGEVLAAARGIDLATHGVLTRHGHTGERPAGAIGFATVRGGDIVGDHTVLFAGTGERIEITHRMSSRANYAAGSLRAARFLANQERGLFGMAQVLGLAT
ncbi:MAG: 4-hydroxy-tetrahydrodipicolinate reductase [Rubrivivax sp.]|nr:4-hydroxy-tetrahydrodipicolinate reductase [Rubrivivax sp.]